MIKRRLSVIFSLLMLFCFCGVGCDGINSNTCTLTLVQEGQKDVVLEVKKGDKPSLPEPARSHKASIVTEWNIADDFVAEKDETIYTTAYTSGLVFNFRDYNFQNCVVVQSYNGSSSEVIVPQYYKGCPIKILADRAFKNQTHVTKITLPEGLEKVQWYPFQGIPNLTSVNIPSTLKILEPYAFCDVKNITPVTIPGGIETVPDHAFMGYAGESVTFEEGVTYIQEYVFGGDYLKDVVLPISIKEISGLAFFYQPIERIFYAGREGDFNAITISENMHDKVKTFYERMVDGDITVYYYSEKQPTFAGNFWHYVDGKVTVWG